MSRRLPNEILEKLTDYDWLYNQYVTLNKKVREIADELGTSTDTVCADLTRLNIPKRKPVAVHPLNPKAINKLNNKEWLIDQYITQDKLITKIAHETGTQTAVVTNYLLLFKIPILKKFHVPGMLGKKHKKETILKISKGTKGHFAWKGSDSPLWKGGVSFGKYCPLFNTTFKEYIREQFERKCYLCGKEEFKNRRRLNIHHVDYNKTSICNGKSWSFIPLCDHCHAVTNGNRYYYFNLLINYWLNNNDIHFIQFMGPVI